MADKKGAKVDYGFTDDQNNPLDMAPFFQYLEKKMKAAHKGDGDVQPSKDILEALHSVYESDDKSLKDHLVPQFFITTRTNPLSLPICFEVLTKYEYVNSLVFKDIQLSEEIFPSITKYMSKSHNIQNLSLINNNLSQSTIKLLFNEMPNYRLVSISFQQQQFTSQTLTAIGVQIQKASLAAWAAAAQEIAEAKKAHEEELEKLKQLEEEAKKQGKKFKPPKVKKAKGQVNVWELQPQDLYDNYFTFEQLKIEFCGLNSEHAGALRILGDMAGVYLRRVSFRGNDLTTTDVSAFFQGVLECNERKPPQPPRYPIMQEAYSGNPQILLTELNLSDNNISQIDESALKIIGIGITKCANLSVIDLGKNKVDDLIGFLLPYIDKQTQIIKVNLPEQIGADKVDFLVNMSKVHMKKISDVAKQVKKLDKEAKARAKAEAKAKPAAAPPPPPPPADQAPEPEAAGAENATAENKTGAPAESGAESRAETREDAGAPAEE